ncbi:MAG: hypothetical protein K8T25_14380 [Planctomycetia bacterium]|nr:hypothetical protein [Planctomycetia bacterium]
MISLAQTLLLSAHLLCVDVAMVGPLVALLLASRQRRLAGEAPGEMHASDTTIGDAGRWLMHRSWQALAVGIVLGLAMGCLLWFAGGRPFFTALERLPNNRLYFGVGELAFYLVLVMCSGFGWDWLQRRPWLQVFMVVLATTNLIYHFPTMFVSVGQLARGSATAPALTGSEYRRLIWTPDILSQVAHHVVSAAAVVGAVLMGYAVWLRDGMAKAGKGSANEQAEGAARWIGLRGARLALGATLTQIPVGLWVLASLPTTARDGVLGSDLLTTGMFLSAMAASLAMLHFLSAAAMGDARRGECITAIALLLLVVVLMTGALRRIEARSWAQDTSPSMREIKPTKPHAT